eukprot:2152649-Prymnesium_polylepis.2
MTWSILVVLGCEGIGCVGITTVTSASIDRQRALARCGVNGSYNILPWSLRAESNYHSLPHALCA